jgi:phosphomannomutase
MSSTLSDAALRGSAQTMNAQACSRIARAFGTLLRRQTSGGGQIVFVARGGDAQLLAMRDGIVAGLILAGHHVKDVGVRTHLLDGAPAAALATADRDGFALTFFIAGRAIAGDALLELAALADADDFSAGEGSLEIV